MKQVYIVAGGNGCGKTTLANKLVEELGLSFVNADEIAKRHGNIEKFKISAGKEFFKSINDLISKEESFIIESTLSGKYLTSFIDKFKSEGYTVTLTYVFVESPELAISRINLRVEKGGHFIPEEDVKRRLRRSLENFEKIYKILVDNWEIHYNGVEGFVLVALGDNNNLSIKEKYLFNKFINL